jgi:hypothetical protein
LRLLAVELRRPRVAAVVVASASACLVVVRHRSSVEGEVEEGEGRGDEEVKRGRENRATANEGFVERGGVLGSLKRRREIHGVVVWPSNSLSHRELSLYSWRRENPAMVINYFDPPLVAGKRAQPIRI